MTKKKRAGAGGKPTAERTLWAYGYEMVAPHPDGIIADVRGLLVRQNAEAVRDGRTWTARLVTTRLIQVLVVSASPELDVDSNRRLEADLAELGVQYLMTAPLRVSDDDDRET
jgi:hypothetical protein